MTTQINNESQQFIEEEIPLSLFHTSEALKNEIGQRIMNRSKTNWDFVQLNSRGAFICLTFKQRTN